MRKTLRRMLDRLRAQTTGTFRRKTSRGGTHEPQRMHGHERS